MEYKFDSFGNLKICAPEEIVATETDSDAILALDRGITEDSRPWWAYIAIPPRRYDQYLHARKGAQAITLSDYGTVLKYGFTKEVPSDVQKEMKERYGFDEYFKENLLNDIQHARKAFLKQRDSDISNIVDMLKHKRTDQV